MKSVKRLATSALSLILAVLMVCFILSPAAVDLSNVYRLTLSGDYVYNLPEGVKAGQLLASLHGNAALYGVDGQSLADTAPVGTGTALSYANGSFTVVVYGDINGDGEVTTADCIITRNVIVGSLQIDGPYLAAVDIDGDGAPSSTDYASIRSHLCGKSLLFASSLLSTEEQSNATPVDPTLSGEEIPDATGTIHFEDGTVTVSGTGVTAVDNYAHVTAGGQYTVTGTTTDGYVWVEAPIEAEVGLTLAGADITNPGGAALYLTQSKKTQITLASGTQNSLADGTTTGLLDKGALFSNDTLVIGGDGALTVTGNRQHGIVSDDDIIINGGNITVTGAVKDAFHANDDITVVGGSLTVSSAGSDALESEGTVNITGGALNLAATGNALKATTIFTATGGDVKVVSSNNAIKGDSAVDISGGTFNLTASNNAIKSDINVAISGGAITINSTGDGIKSHSVDPTVVGETRTFYNYGAIDGDIATVGNYVWTQGSVSASATYWAVAVAQSNGMGGYIVTDVYASGVEKTFTVPSGGIALLAHVSADSYSNVCLIQKDDTITYDTATTQVTVTTPGNYLGEVNVTGGNMHISAANDGIEAGGLVYLNNTDTALTSASGISTGAYNLYILSAGGASTTVDSTSGSYKAIKSDDCIYSDYIKLYASSPEDTLQAQDEITLTDGIFTVYSGRDGIASANVLTVNGGTYAIKTAGGYSESISSTDTNSYKALKGTGSITIGGGTFDLNSKDDAVHSNGAVTISGGTFTVATGDDGVHSDTTTTISGGYINVTSSYEGVEGLNVAISGGTVKVVASDDGVNAAGGADGSGTTQPGRPGGGGWGGSMGGDTSKYSLTISGTAFVWISCSGDGMDSNGALTISGGTLFVQQSGGGNSGLDADGTRLINGGLVVVLDGGDMVELPASSSTQYCFSSSISSSVSAGTVLAITDASGNLLVAAKSEKSFKHMIISCPSFASGASYKVYTGGTVSGTFTNGLCTAGTYTAGTLKKTVTLSGKVTSA